MGLWRLTEGGVKPRDAMPGRLADDRPWPWDLVIGRLADAGVRVCALAPDRLNEGDTRLDIPTLRRLTDGDLEPGAGKLDRLGVLPTWLRAPGLLGPRELGRRNDDALDDGPLSRDPCAALPCDDRSLEEPLDGLAAADEITRAVTSTNTIEPTASRGAAETLRPKCLMADISFPLEETKLRNLSGSQGCQ